MQLFYLVHENWIFSVMIGNATVHRCFDNCVFGFLPKVAQVQVLTSTHLERLMELQKIRRGSGWDD